MRKSEIQIRDPFVLPVAATGEYYLFGSTDKNIWSGPGQGFDCYRSRDLEDWEGPIPAFHPPPGFWGTTQYWAPEAHVFRGRYYLFATFKAEGRYRGTQILTSANPEGPYVPLTDGPVTPPDWECLDGSLHVDAEGNPWIVFCHEWVQVHNGGMHAMRLAADLTHAVAKPVFLFNGSEAPWAPRQAWPEKGATRSFPHYVTDGPFLFRTRDDSLLMLWSSFARKGYAMGLARSLSGRVEGPWIQDAKPLWEEDGGHGMIFQSFGGQLFLTLHSPNQSPHERPFFYAIEDIGSTVRLKP